MEFTTANTKLPLYTPSVVILFSAYVSIHKKIKSNTIAPVYISREVKNVASSMLLSSNPLNRINQERTKKIIFIQYVNFTIFTN